jgi:fatty acid desaturase
VSKDARNSIVLWVSVVALFAAFWAISRFELMGWFPEEWVFPAIAVMLLINIIDLFATLVRRRKQKTEDGNG